ncbi:MAG: decaprenyl-phosphate phosphoribosyltransferase [Ktedonobacteraceae bacterium]|nr:decaprenyl-phosphate phosphoribosyltransferase [Ktedonobacteraceae bacterium]
MKKATATRDDQAGLETTTSCRTLSVRANGERVQALITALRPRQWIKNFAVFIGLVFAQHLFDVRACERATLAFVTFCLLASCIYLLNDLFDLENDRQHPLKRTRPLACGQLPVSWAVITIAILLATCALLLLALHRIPIQHDIFTPLGGADVLFTLTLLSYFVVMVLYSIYLKHVVLIDVFVIASGFVLRTLAGTVVIAVATSSWLYMVACFLALFLALSKRRNELVILQEQASHHRQILKEYSVPMLNQMITIAVSATIMAYSLYTIEGATASHDLLITVPIVLYGMFRYLYLIYMKMEGGSPEEVLLRDRFMLGTVTLYILMIVITLYILPRVLLQV